MTGISTPCIKICVIDPVRKLCEGCGRTLAEIAQWGRLTEPERRAIMTELPGRLQGDPPEPPRHARI